jgi:inhibitor of cysteine peptidase
MKENRRGKMKTATNKKFWKYTRFSTILLMVFAVILSGCVDEGQDGNESENMTDNSQGTNGTNNSQETDEEDYVYGTAKVENIQILILESFPVQVQVIAEGYLPDGCTEIDKIKTEREGNIFNISISTKRPKDAICTQALESFTETIHLDVQGLKAGNYTVNVNGVIGSFELAVDNIIQKESPGPIPPGKRVVTEADNGTNISVENGETFYLKLPENPSTGYRWELNLTQGLNVTLGPDGRPGEYYPPEQPEGIEQPLVGAEGVRIWEIKAVAEGGQQVTAVYKRPFENETAEGGTFTLNVEVV